MSELINRMANLMICHMFAAHERPVCDELFARYQDTARTVLKGMLSPTPLMMAAGDIEMDNEYLDGPEDIWRAMVQAELKANVDKPGSFAMELGEESKRQFPKNNG